MAAPSQSENSPTGPPDSAWREWRASDGSAVVFYDRGIIEGIRSELILATHAIGNGGVEIGGLLLGRKTGEGYRIDGWRRIRCDHARGPGFLLSERDLALLSAQLEGVRGDPALEGRQVIGWLVSHNKGDLEPRLEEAKLHAKFFGWPASLLATAQTTKFGDAHIAIHVFEPGTPPSLRPLDPPLHVLPASGPLKFSDSAAAAALNPSAMSAGGSARRPVPSLLYNPAVRNEPRSAEPAASKQVVDERPMFAQSLPAPRVRRRGVWAARLAWIALAALLVFVGSAYMALKNPASKSSSQQAALVAQPAPEPSGPPKPLLSLHVRGIEDGVRISWDPASFGKTGLQGGVLRVVDRGEIFTRELSSAELDLGRIDYTRSKGELLVQLEVRSGGGRLSERVHFKATRLP